MYLWFTVANIDAEDFVASKTIVVKYRQKSYGLELLNLLPEDVDD